MWSGCSLGLKRCTAERRFGRQGLTVHGVPRRCHTRVTLLLVFNLPLYFRQRLHGGCRRRPTLQGRGNRGGKARLGSLVDSVTVDELTVTVETTAALAEAKVLLETSYLRILPALR